MFCLDMLAMAMELAHDDPAYEDVASKFFEHFVYIAQAMNDIGGERDRPVGRPGRFLLRRAALGGDTSMMPMKVRSMVGLIPLFAVETYEPRRTGTQCPGFCRRMHWFLDHNPDVAEHVDMSERTEEWRRGCCFRIANRKKLERIYRYVLDENEFSVAARGAGAFEISPGSSVRAAVMNEAFASGGLRAGRITTGDLFGGNSNWRGPGMVPDEFPADRIVAARALLLWRWFQSGDIRRARGSRKHCGKWAQEVSRRLSHIFLRQDGRRAVYGGTAFISERSVLAGFDSVLSSISTAIHGAGLGASHQTGWTALVAKLIEQSGGVSAACLALRSLASEVRDQSPDPAKHG